MPHLSRASPVMLRPSPAPTAAILATALKLMKRE